MLVAEAFRKKIHIKKIQNLSKIDNWFLEQIKEIVDAENKIQKKVCQKTTMNLTELNQLGFSDKKLSEITKYQSNIIRKKRTALKVLPVYKKVDTCAAEFKSFTPVYVFYLSKKLFF